MQVASKSDLGKKRKNNEDKIFVDENKGIFILADGMGGHEGGEVASNLAVNAAYSYLKYKVPMEEINVEEIRKFLVEAMFKAHEEVKQKALTNSELRGMGTTLIEVLIVNQNAYICHVGDSRVYLMQDSLKQITNDHTVGDYLVKNNIMKREEVPPRKWNALTQAVGTSDQIVPDLNYVELKEGDFLLLCSDGLTGMLSDKDIEDIILKYKTDINKTVDMLVQKANNNGGTDNISIILIGLVENSSEKSNHEEQTAEGLLDKIKKCCRSFPNK